MKQSPTMIHCYCFSKGENYVNQAIQQIEQVLGQKLLHPTVDEIRDVSPKKFMLCISFQWPQLQESAAIIDDDSQHQNCKNSQQEKRKSKDTQETSTKKSKPDLVNNSFENISS